MSVRMYSYRIYPTKKQKMRLENNLLLAKKIYNMLLEANRTQYEETGKGLRKYDYNNYVKGEYEEMYAQVRQNISDRVYKAYQNFFRRLKNPNEKNGYPRFKSKVNSITYPQKGFKLVSDKRLYASRIGNIPIVLHRVPKGKIKTMTIKQNNIGQFFVFLSCEIEDKLVMKKKKNKKSIGIDVGINKFATLSDETIIENPKHLLKSEEKLKLLQRSLSRKKKGSNNRIKARYKVAKQHLKVSNQRKDFLHKLSHSLTKKYSTIVVEDLRIRNMVKNHHLAKHISDASWGAFIQYLEYKAVTSGSKFVKVNPRNTSKICSDCGNINDMPLSKRTIICECGHKEDRDLNAAKNILKVGQDLSEPNACEEDIRPSRKANLVETGTIHNDY